MAKTDTLHIRIEPSVKEKAEETLSELGLSISDAINVFLRQVIINDGIPFEIRKANYNRITLKAMDDAKKQKNVSETFDNVDEMFEELDK
jgi:DNA-damage-inducible protein J